MDNNILKMIEEGVNDLPHHVQLKWADFSMYLEKEKAAGKHEFRLVVNADDTFYVHPLNVDGETFNGKL